jgi:hypothetical protein
MLRMHHGDARLYRLVIARSELMRARRCEKHEAAIEQIAPSLS